MSCRKGGHKGHENGPGSCPSGCCWFEEEEETSGGSFWCYVGWLKKMRPQLRERAEAGGRLGRGVKQQRERGSFTDR